MSSDDDRKARLPYGGKNRLLELPSPYPGNADAWEALWLADQATYSFSEEGPDELTEVQS